MITPQGGWDTPPTPEPGSKPVETKNTSSSRGVVCWLLGAAFLGMFLLVATIQGEYGSQSIFKDFLHNTFRISDDDADVYLSRARAFCLGAGIVFVVAGFVRRFGSRPTRR
jgi:hypothetical protein